MRDLLPSTEDLSYLSLPSFHFWQPSLLDNIHRDFHPGLD